MANGGRTNPLDKYLGGLRKALGLREVFLPQELQISAGINAVADAVQSQVGSAFNNLDFTSILGGGGGIPAGRVSIIGNLGDVPLDPVTPQIPSRFVPRDPDATIVIDSLAIIRGGGIATIIVAPYILGRNGATSLLRPITMIAGAAGYTLWGAGAATTMPVYGIPIQTDPIQGLGATGPYAILPPGQFLFIDHGAVAAGVSFSVHVQWREIPAGIKP